MNIALDVIEVGPRHSRRAYVLLKTFPLKVHPKWLQSSILLSSLKDCFESGRNFYTEGCLGFILEWTRFASNNFRDGTWSAFEENDKSRFKVREKEEDFSREK